MTTTAVSSSPTKRLDLGIKQAMDVAKELAKADNVPSLKYPQNTVAAPAAQPSEPAPAANTPSGSETTGGKAPKSNVTPLGNVAEKKQKAAHRAPVKRFSVDLPLYAIEDIREKAHRAKLTKREYILAALNRGGITIKDIDIREPGDE